MCAVVMDLIIMLSMSVAVPVLDGSAVCRAYIVNVLELLDETKRQKKKNSPVSIVVLPLKHHFKKTK